MSDLSKEIAQTVIRIKTEMRKAQFASRSEAGRYAANQRWKGQGKKGKTALDDLSIRGMTQTKWNIDELRTHIDEQEGLLEAMRDNGASKAELKQQKGLITLARRDLRRMEEEQEEVVGVNKFPVQGKAIKESTHSASYRKYRADAAISLEKVFSEKTLVKAGEGLISKGYGDDRAATKEDIAFGAETAKSVKETIGSFEKEVDDALIALDNNFGDRSTHLKTLQKVKNKFAALARKSEIDQKAAGHFPENKEDNTVRSMIYSTKSLILKNVARDLAFVIDQEKAIDKGNQSRMNKGKSFASRSEAGRYAANMRWKGQGQASAASGGSSLKHKVDFEVMSSGRFTHVQGQAFDGQVKYIIGNENEFPDDMDYGFAFSMPGEGFIHAAILKSGFSQKVMSNRNHTPSLDEIKGRAVELNQELGRAVSDHLKTLNIREIAKGIEQEYTRVNKTIPKAVANAVAALKPLRDINDVYGYSTGQRIVADALKSLKSFDSEVGKMVQAELKSRVKDASPKPPTAGMRRAKSLPFAELRSN